MMLYGCKVYFFDNGMEPTVGQLKRLCALRGFLELDDKGTVQGNKFWTERCGNQEGKIHANKIIREYNNIFISNGTSL